jgi:hypothetical protein
MSEATPATDSLHGACDVLEEVLRGDTSLPPRPVVERLLVLAAGAAAATWEDTGRAPALEPGAELTPTVAARVAGALLRTADIELFEFALWQMWGVCPEREVAHGG